MCQVVILTQIQISFQQSQLLNDFQKLDFLFLQPRIYHFLYLTVKSKSSALFRLKVKKIIRSSTMTNKRLINIKNNRKKMRTVNIQDFLWLTSIHCKLFLWFSAWNSILSSSKKRVMIWKMKFLRRLDWLERFAFRELKLSLLNI